jgi:mono/diheme cytochrome c family protein
MAAAHRSALALVLPVLVLAACARSASAPSELPRVEAASEVAAGRYLVIAGGCNDCHTPGWNESFGAVPEARWLTGSPVGFQGPWGTTYASNLRLLADAMSEQDFLAMLHTRKDRPPMPWMNVNRLSEADARAIYRFLKALGPAGQPAPTGLQPGQAPRTPYITLSPQPAPQRVSAPR